jgi:hypothetical protein
MRPGDDRSEFVRRHADGVSAVLVYQLAPKWDTYIGTLYSRLSGGLDSGFLATDNWSTTGGARFRW